MSCFTERVKQLIIYIHSAKKNKTVFSKRYIRMRNIINLLK